MKRKNIISKLLENGFTEKTLITMTDKQLNMLSERILSEQSAVTTPIVSTRQLWR